MLAVATQSVAFAGQALGPISVPDGQALLCRISPISNTAVCVPTGVHIPLKDGGGGGSAGGCSQQGCDNLDPVDTGCTSSAYLAAQQQMTLSDGQRAGDAQNWYSSNCGTNYSRAVLDSPPCGNTAECSLQVHVTGPWGTSDTYSSASLQTEYSNQEYSPGHNCADAYTFYDTGNPFSNNDVQAC